MKKLFKILLIMTILVIIGYFSLSKMLAPVNSTDKRIITVTIPERSTVANIGEILEENGLIKSRYLFKYYVHYKKMDTKLQAGTYNLSPSMSLDQIAEMLKKGEKVRIMFTIPEGYTVKQIAHLLSEKGLVNYDEFMKLTLTKRFPFSFLTYDDNLRNPLEGYLFPDTYYVPEDYGEEAIITMMLKRFSEVFDKGMIDQAKKRHLSIKQVVTMASLVEREAKIPEERPIIAGVFYNRLQKKMRLESCATIQYLLEKQKPILYLQDLEINSPYNTYRNFGLPPGPIANPGKASLLAALEPANTKYLYFVAKKDGSHYFSKTLAEHVKAKQKYLQKGE